MKLGPPPTPNRTAHPFKGSLVFHGLAINIENPEGSFRSGVAKDGTKWRTQMKGVHYGEFAATEGMDGDPVDVFVGPTLDAENAYVIHTKHPGTRVDDETKVMIGFATAELARRAFFDHYQNKGFFNGITKWPAKELAEFLKRRGPRPAGRLDTPGHIEARLDKAIAATPIEDIRAELRRGPIGALLGVDGTSGPMRLREMGPDGGPPSGLRDGNGQPSNRDADRSSMRQPLMRQSSSPVRSDATREQSPQGGGGEASEGVYVQVDQADRGDGSRRPQQSSGRGADSRSGDGIQGVEPIVGERRSRTDLAARRRPADALENGRTPLLRQADATNGSRDSATIGQRSERNRTGGDIQGELGQPPEGHFTGVVGPHRMSKAEPAEEHKTADGILQAWRIQTEPEDLGGYSLGKGPKGVSASAPNYRLANTADRVCTKCRFARAGECVTYGFRFDPAYVCDSMAKDGGDYETNAPPMERSGAAQFADAVHQMAELEETTQQQADELVESLVGMEPQAAKAVTAATMAAVVPQDLEGVAGDATHINRDDFRHLDAEGRDLFTGEQAHPTHASGSKPVVLMHRLMKARIGVRVAPPQPGAQPAPPCQPAPGTVAPPRGQAKAPPVQPAQPQAPQEPHPTVGHKVRFHHPSTGETKEGTVTGVGAHGATIHTAEGEKHKVEHGHYAVAEGSEHEPPKKDEAKPDEKSEHEPSPEEKALFDQAMKVAMKETDDKAIATKAAQAFVAVMQSPKTKMAKGTHADSELALRRAIEYAMARGAAAEVDQFRSEWEKEAEAAGQELLGAGQEAEFDALMDSRDMLAGQLTAEDLRKNLGQVELTTKDGVAFRSGTPVTFKYARALESGQMGFGADFQPAGAYVFHMVDFGGMKGPGWDTGEMSFRNPLVLEWVAATSEPQGWRARLSYHFGGKAGKDLSRAIRLAGYDGVVTVRSAWNEAGEIVDLRRTVDWANMAPTRVLMRLASQVGLFGPKPEGSRVTTSDAFRMKRKDLDAALQQHAGHEPTVSTVQAEISRREAKRTEPEKAASPVVPVRERDVGKADERQPAQNEAVPDTSAQPATKHTETIHVKAHIAKTEHGLVQVKEHDRKVEKRSEPSKVEKHTDVGETIYGARKHTWVPSEGVHSRNIDSLEAEGENTAIRHVIKKNVLPDQEPAALRDAGNTPGAVWLKRKLIDAIATGPAPKAGSEMRRFYVSGAEWLAKEIDRLHTGTDVIRFIENWREMARGNMLEEHTYTPDELIEKFGAVPSNKESRKLSGGGFTIRRGSRTFNSEKTKAKGAMVPVYDESQDYAEFAISGDVMRAAGYSKFTEKTDAQGRRVYQLYRQITGENTFGKYAIALGGVENPTAADVRDSRLLRVIYGGLGRKSVAFWDKDVPIARLMDVKNDWSQLIKGDEATPKRKGERWTRATTSPRRNGGPQVDLKDVSGDRLMREFGFRGVQHGNWVNDESRDYHMARTIEALTDLADVLQLDPKALTNGGSLAIAFGARGSGKAGAHYEPGLRVINLTHTNGAGALAHELGHFFDHIMVDDPAAMSIEPGGKATAPFVSSGGSSARLHPEVAAAFRDVMRTMREGGPENEAQVAAEWDKIKANGRDLAKQRDALFEARKSVKGAEPPEILEKVAAYNAAVEAHNKRERKVRKYMANRGKMPSKFLRDAEGLGSAYWATPHEMFARCFESYVEDKLAGQERANTYLVEGTRKFYARGGEDGERSPQPYAHGEERTRINAAMDTLVKTMAKHQTLQKAMSRVLVRHRPAPTTRILVRVRPEAVASS